jgi:hypothetical protein
MKVEVPRGIEVLVKKAVVDPEFKGLLLAERSGAAAEIGLKLSDAEATMFDAVPAEQLEAIIGNTTVSPKIRPAFTGRVAAVMLAALGTALVGCHDEPTGPPTDGIRPDRPDGRYDKAGYEEMESPDVGEADSTELSVE